jgi:uncharacterized protein
MTLTVACPTCQKAVPWDAKLSPSRPFCSERCRLIDLGEWADEQHRIASSEVPVDLEFMSDEELVAVATRLLTPREANDN